MLEDKTIGEVILKAARVLKRGKSWKMRCFHSSVIYPMISRDISYEIGYQSGAHPYAHNISFLGRYVLRRIVPIHGNSIVPTLLMSAMLC